MWKKADPIAPSKIISTKINMKKTGYYRKSGELFLQNLSLKKLVDRYETPTFVYD